MKLKNRKTGEIIEVESLDVDSPTEGIVGIPSLDRKGSYNSLAELNAEWEDAPEEPKRHWIIDTMNDRVEDFDVPMTFNESIGNYFETKEEAEKAVEKLKAWKRLKGVIVGWSFSYNLDLNGCTFDDEDIIVGIKLPRNTNEKDLDLLFSGEDD